MALEELDADGAGDTLVDAVHVGVEVAAQRLPPLAGVHEVAPLAVQVVLELVLVDRADEALELGMRGEDDRGGRDLVDVAHLQADDAVLDVVHDADAVAAADVGGPLEQVDEAQAYQSETQIIAPISGFISEKMTNPGEIISAGFPLFTIVKAQDFKVKVYADESKFGFLRLNQPVKIVLPALANAEVDGQILRVSQAADFATKKATNEQGTFDVRAMEVVVKVLSQDPRLRNGMTARVKVPTTTSRP